MRKFVGVTSIFFSGLAIAQGLPRFGTAKFGEAAFGELNLPYPFPLCPFGQPSPSQWHCEPWPI